MVNRYVYTNDIYLYGWHFLLSRGVYLFIHGKIYKAQKGGLYMVRQFGAVDLVG